MSAECGPDDFCALFVCDGADDGCSCDGGWTGRCKPRPGEGEGEDDGGESEGEGEGELPSCDISDYDVADVIIGNVRIDTVDGLSLLNGRRAIAGTLIINLPGSTTLPSLAIEMVSGAVRLSVSTPDLTALSALRCAGSLEIKDSPGLVRLEGISQELVVEGSVAYVNNDALTTLVGSPVPGTDLVVKQNDVLPDLSGLPTLTHLTGALIVEHNALLTSYAGLEALREIDQLRVGPGAPTSLAGLESVTSIAGALSLENLALTSTVGLSSLAEVGTLLIGELPLVDVVEGFDALTTVGALILTGAEAPPSLAGLTSLRQVRRFEVSGTRRVTTLSDVVPEEIERILILDNENLTTIGMLGQLATVTSLSVARNPRLTDLGQVGAPGSTLGFLQVTDCPLLTTIGGLPQVVDGAGGLSLERLPTLSTLPALQRWPIARLRLVDVPRLETLDGLQVQTALSVTIERAGIGDLGALRDVTTLLGTPTFRENPRLGNCEAERFVVARGHPADDRVRNNRGASCFCR